jgi:colanic acid biosynthesis glycosyl transferase WcaI
VAKILVASINFAPDHAGIGVYSTDFPVYLAEQGDQVTMVTGFPYYPQWRKRRKDHGRLFSREFFRNVDVRRGYLYVPRKTSAIHRSWHEFTFCFFAALNMVRAGHHDVIVIFSPPFFLGLVGLAFRWFWRCRLMINVQDLPLDGAVALGMIRTGLFTRMLRMMERWIYRKADLVATISPTMLSNLQQKGVALGKLVLIPNWIDVAPNAMHPSIGSFMSRHPEARGKFTVAYAGNLGIKQGVDMLLHLANRLKSDGGMHFFIIGDGADRMQLERLAVELATPNLTFLPFMNPPEYRDMLADIDMVFVAQRSGAGNNFFPSKLLGLMAQSKPLLVAADDNSELARVIRETGCGVVSAYGDIEGMAKNLGRLKSSREDMLEMGRRGREKVQEFDRATVLADWRRMIGELLAD